MNKRTIAKHKHEREIQRESLMESSRLYSENNNLWICICLLLVVIVILSQTAINIVNEHKKGTVLLRGNTYCDYETENDIHYAYSCYVQDNEKKEVEIIVRR